MQKHGNTEFVAQHVPLSFCVVTNVPGFTTPYFEVSQGDSQELVNKMLDCILAASEKVFELLKQNYEPLMDQLKAYVCKQAELERVKPEDHPLFSYVTRLVAHIKSLLLIGFNSGNYDINLIRSHLVKLLMQKGEKFIVTKRGNKFLCLSTSSLKFLEICSYLPPGPSLAAYVKIFGCKLQKFFFPYGWMTSPEKLKETQPPPA